MWALENEVSRLPHVITVTSLSHPTGMIGLSDLLQYALTLLDGTSNAAYLTLGIR